MADFDSDLAAVLGSDNEDEEPTPPAPPPPASSSSSSTSALSSSSASKRARPSVEEPDREHDSPSKGVKEQSQQKPASASRRAASSSSSFKDALLSGGGEDGDILSRIKSSSNPALPKPSTKEAARAKSASDRQSKEGSSRLPFEDMKGEDADEEEDLEDGDLSAAADQSSDVCCWLSSVGFARFGFSAIAVGSS